jgi:Nanos RNA binding domain
VLPSETIIMSKTFNTTATATTKTPYCKVCHDAGRPSSEYTSHYVKDQPGPNGKVVCPTLLNQACRICNKTGHTSSYCVENRSRRSEEPRREEPRREERYIEREQQPRREERREEREQPRREEPHRNSYNRLRDDTERSEREIRDRDDSYHREQDRRSKPWLQAALRPSSSSLSSHERRAPYAHPHGPRVRLSLESAALSVSKHADVAVAIASVDQNQQQPQTAVDVLKVDLHHAKSWGDEPFECNPEQMFRELAQDCLMSNLTRGEEFDFMAACDNDNN